MEHTHSVWWWTEKKATCVWLDLEVAVWESWWSRWFQASITKWVWVCLELPGTVWNCLPVWWSETLILLLPLSLPLFLYFERRKIVITRRWEKKKKGKWNIPCTIWYMSRRYHPDSLFNALSSAVGNGGLGVCGEREATEVKRKGMQGRRRERERELIWGAHYPYFQLKQQLTGAVVNFNDPRDRKENNSELLMEYSSSFPHNNSHSDTITPFNTFVRAPKQTVELTPYAHHAVVGSILTLWWVPKKNKIIRIISLLENPKKSVVVVE